MALGWPVMGHAAKTDVLVLRNGDRITGEVMSLSRGKLDYKTDDAGRLTIEWVKVAHLTSSQVFEVEVASGVKYLGRLAAADVEGALVVEGVRVDTLAISSVVRMSELETAFLRRMRAHLDVGLTIAKANQATTFTMAGEALYRGSKYGGLLSFNSYVQGQESTATTTQNGISLQGIRFLPDRWSAFLVAQSAQNDELNLDLRVTVGGGMGRFLHQSNQSSVAAGAGLVVARERYAPDTEGSGVGDTTDTNVDVQLSAQWDTFRYDSPKLDVSTSLNLYPSLTTLGRVRGDFSLRLKYELFADFNVGLNLTDSFDSRPPEEDASHNDYIASFTIGWSYRR